ncbi:MAG: alpha/beta hydrolase [Chloroflexota bacterium]|nr:alpha/beta hydrolase [Chloroflexota bacterium]
MSTLREHWTTVDGLRVYAQVGTDYAGSAAHPIVLVHGYAVASGYLLPTARDLAAEHPVFVPDLPGSGKSDRPDRVLTLPELADALAAWVDANRIGEAVLLGQSFGCQIVAHFAVRRPDLVSALVLVGPTTDPAARSLPKLLWRLLKDIVREHPMELLIAARDYLRFGPRWALKTARIMLRDRIEEVLPRVDAPVLVVRGEHDPIASPEWVEGLAAVARDGAWAVIPDGAHAVNFDEPDRLAAAVRRFLAERAV